MIRNYLTVAWRNLMKSKAFSIINIAGLSVGMAVAMLIGLWIWDELSFNKNHDNYDRIVKVMQHQTFNGDKGTQSSVPYVLGEQLRKEYSGDFKYVSMASWIGAHVLATGEKKLTKSGIFMEAQTPDMLSLKMIKGSRAALQNTNSIILSASAAKAVFGDEEPVNKMMKLDNKLNVKVTGVYEDIPYNADFKDLSFIAPWQLYIDDQKWDEKTTNPWKNNSFQLFAQVADNVNIEQLSDKIKDVKLRQVHAEEAVYKPEVFLHPMKKWHLFSEWKNGIYSGGQIQFVWMFGIIGVFVLLLACINFMNLSTARSEKRSKEVGIRKAIGSLRKQLIYQFYCESLLIVAFAFLLSLALVELSLPYFNAMADKQMHVPFNNPVFWALCVCFILITGIVAGSYPALYLSSFKPVKVLKGTFKAGRLAAIPRKAMVVLQFTVSIVLIIGTITVFRQINFARNRPTGYSREGLIAVSINTPELYGHYDALRKDLLETGAVTEMSQSSNPATELWAINNGFEWEGKRNDVQGNFGNVSVSHEYGKTVGWQIIDGRDFSRDFSTDTSAMIVNEAAAAFMGMKKPVGQIVKASGTNYKIIGVIKDMVMESPYTPVFRTMFFLDYGWANYINVKLSPSLGPKDAIAKIEPVFRKYNPNAPFDYKFVDDQYEKKFVNEQRIGKLASSFTILAILISCLGLFGMASFMAEQRTKEIGIRKVLGASLFTLWQLLSKDFTLLVVISLFVATPIAYMLMNSWLQNYQYRLEMSWWIFAAAGLGAVLITLLTVSYQGLKTGLSNPVKSLRSE